MTEKLKELVADFGGGRKKMNDESQLYYNTAKDVITKFWGLSAYDIEIFAEYLKLVTKKSALVMAHGYPPDYIEQNPEPDFSIRRDKIHPQAHL